MDLKKSRKQAITAKDKMVVSILVFNVLRL